MFIDFYTLLGLIGEDSPYRDRLMLIPSKEDALFYVNTSDSGVYVEVFDESKGEMIVIPVGYEYERYID